MNQPLVAIVVPVFNGADHLAECLESILAQTYSNWQALVMDNCSTDGTGAIADEFARRDPRLRVVHSDEFILRNENYNRALGMAGDGAEYIKIVEADNWITEDCLERMVRVAQQDATIGLVTSYWLRNRSLFGDGLACSERIISGVEVVRRFCLDRTNLFGTPTCMLFRARALREESVWFSSLPCCDDVDICVRLLRRWNFGFVHQVLAYVRADDTGAFSKTRDFDFRPAYMYFAVHAYGGDFFTEPELQDLRRVWERRYFECLGRARVTGRSKAYWQFHQGMFKFSGRSLPTGALLLPAVRVLIDLALNPKSTLEKLVKRSS